MELNLLYFVTFSAIISLSIAGELTFELQDNDQQCFFEEIDKGVESTLEFQVVTGGNYDVDMELQAPNGRSLYKDVRKQYDSVTWTAEEKGVHKFCFSNEFSTFSHKVIYFDLQVGDDDPLLKNGDPQQTAMTLMETSGMNIHENLNGILDDQTYFKLHEAQGRAFAEDLNHRVMLWSISESVVVLLIGLGQVLVLRSFFTEKKNFGLPNAH